MLDPRKDLQQDSALWELVLACATVYNDVQIYGNLHGFRCCGAQLKIKEDTLSLSLPKNLDEDIKKEMKRKYITPYIKQIKELFKFIAEYCEMNKGRDYVNRDILNEGYLF